MTTEEKCNCRNAAQGNQKDSSGSSFKLPCVVRKENNQLGYDIIWDAIPFYELLDYAKVHHDICSIKSDDEIRLCADQVVRSVICPCCADQEQIINTIVEEFISQLNNSKDGGR